MLIELYQVWQGVVLSTRSVCFCFVCSVQSKALQVLVELGAVCIRAWCAYASHVRTHATGIHILRIHYLDGCTLHGAHVRACEGESNLKSLQHVSSHVSSGSAHGQTLRNPHMCRQRPAPMSTVGSSTRCPLERGRTRCTPHQEGKNACAAHMFFRTHSALMQKQCCKIAR